MEKEIISASIVTYNNGDTAYEICSELVKKTGKYNLKLYVFDNASSDDTVEKIKKISGISVFENQSNLGFGSAHNGVLSKEMGKYHFVINPDIMISDDILSKMADFMEENPEVVMAMPKILNTDGTEQFLPKEVPNFKYLFLGRLSEKIRADYIWQGKKITQPTDVDFCTGCFFCIRSDVFKKLGGFDERYFMYMEDADLTLRAKKYGRVVMVPNISVTHEWERTSAKNIKYLMIHIFSAFKFFLRKRGLLK